MSDAEMNELIYITDPKTMKVIPYISSLSTSDADITMASEDAKTEADITMASEDAKTEAKTELPTFQFADIAIHNSKNDSISQITRAIGGFEIITHSN